MTCNRDRHAHEVDGPEGSSYTARVWGCVGIVGRSVEALPPWLAAGGSDWELDAVSSPAACRERHYAGMVLAGRPHENRDWLIDLFRAEPPPIAIRPAADGSTRTARLLFRLGRSSLLLRAEGNFEALWERPDGGEARPVVQGTDGAAERWWRTLGSAAGVSETGVLLRATRRTRDLLNDWLYPRRSLNHYRDVVHPPIRLPPRFRRLGRHSPKPRTLEVRTLDEAVEIVPPVRGRRVLLVRAPRVGEFDPLSLVCPPLSFGSSPGCWSTSASRSRSITISS